MSANPVVLQHPAPSPMPAQAPKCHQHKQKQPKRQQGGGSTPTSGQPKATTTTSSADATDVAKRAPRLRPSNGNHLAGPCRNCSAEVSPQWRRGTPDKPVLCNACGIRLRRHKCLEDAISTGHCKGRSMQGIMQAAAITNNLQNLAGITHPMLLWMMPQVPQTANPAAQVTSTGTGTGANSSSSTKSQPVQSGSVMIPTSAVGAPTSHSLPPAGAAGSVSPSVGVAAPSTVKVEANSQPASTSAIMHDTAKSIMACSARSNESSRSDLAATSQQQVSTDTPGISQKPINMLPFGLLPSQFMWPLTGQLTGSTPPLPLPNLGQVIGFPVGSTAANSLMAAAELSRRGGLVIGSPAGCMTSAVSHSSNPLLPVTVQGVNSQSVQGSTGTGFAPFSALSITSQLPHQLALQGQHPSLVASTFANMGMPSIPVPLIPAAGLPFGMAPNYIPLSSVSTAAAAPIGCPIPAVGMSEAVPSMPVVTDLARTGSSQVPAPSNNTNGAAANTSAAASQQPAEHNGLLRQNSRVSVIGNASTSTLDPVVLSSTDAQPGAQNSSRKAAVSVGKLPSKRRQLKRSSSSSGHASSSSPKRQKVDRRHGSRKRKVLRASVPESTARCAALDDCTDNEHSQDLSEALWQPNHLEAGDMSSDAALLDLELETSDTMHTDMGSNGGSDSTFDMPYSSDDGRNTSDSSNLGVGGLHPDQQETTTAAHKLLADGNLSFGITSTTAGILCSSDPLVALDHDQEAYDEPNCDFSEMSMPNALDLPLNVHDPTSESWGNSALSSLGTFDQLSSGFDQDSQLSTLNAQQLKDDYQPALCMHAQCLKELLHMNAVVTD